MRAIGVEEELLLVDPRTGQTSAVSTTALRRHRGDAEMDHEFFLEQLETQTAPHKDLSALADDVVAARREAVAAARAAGAALVASGTSPLHADENRVTPKARYERMAAEFGALHTNASVCGMHVHVDVTSDDEAVAVVDRMRAWLPVLVALSANSPYADGRDTGHASWRSQVWGGWPTAGPTEAFGDAATYRRTVEALVASGAALDEGMIYFDTRLARSFPTVEIRVNDVCTDVRDVPVVAALARALVETEARAWSDGALLDPWRVEVLRASRWHAARYGLSDQLLDPTTARLAPASDVVDSLLAHVHDALEDAGDTSAVVDGTRRLLSKGTGADHQREAGADGDLLAVVTDLARRTDPDA